MKKLLFAIIMTIVLSGFTSAQGVAYPGVASTTTTLGSHSDIQKVLPGATVTICQYHACPTPATICTDITCGTASPTNTVTADAQGNFVFYALPGNYTYKVSGAGAITKSFDVSVGGNGLGDPGANGPVKRTAPNTTAPALYGDIVNLWTSCGANFMKGDGTCEPGTINTGTGEVLLNPVVDQPIVQPVGTQFSANVQDGTRTVTASFNWSQSPSGTLTGGVEATVTLTPCPVGIDVANETDYGGYGIRITGTGTAEAVAVTGGTCTSGGASGTIVFTPANDHSAGWTVGSATQGVQESLNDAGDQNYHPHWHVVVPPKMNPSPTNGYDIYWPIIIKASRGRLDGPGAVLNCHTRSRCLQVGNLTNGNSVFDVVVSGLRFSARVVDYGCLITSISQTAGVRTANYTGSCTYQVGDFIRVDFTDNALFWGDHVVSAASAGSVSWIQGAGDIALVNSPGTVALANDAVLDNAQHTRFENLMYQGNVGLCDPGGTSYCKFNAFYDFWDDESAVIDGFDNGAFALICGTTYCGSFIYSGGGVGGSYGTGGVLASVIAASHLNITANGGNGVTVYNSNNVTIKDSVIQATCLWNFHISNIKGNYQGGTISDVYNESVGCSYSPYGNNVNAGNAGLIAGPSTGAAIFKHSGMGLGGFVPIVGSGSTTSVYWVVAVSGSYQTVPMLAMSIRNNQTGTVQPFWPRIPNATSYDLLRTVGSVGSLAGGVAAPMAGTGNCPGGSITACGSVATGLTQAAVCTGNGGLICSYTDDVSAATSAYTVPSNGTWAPIIPFWPGTLTVSSTLGGEHIFFDNPPSYVNATRGWDKGPVISTNTREGGAENTWFGNGTEDPRASYSQGMLLTNYSTGTASTVKGRVNFRSNSIPGPMSIITLVDSNPGKTMGTSGHRPVMDSNDTYIGVANMVATDSTHVHLAFGAPETIENYIGSLPNGSFLEQLSATRKRLTVDNVMVDNSLSVFRGCTGCAPFTLAGQQVFDNFNRANGTLGANWNVITGTFAVASSRGTITGVDGTNHHAVAVYTGTFANDQYAQAMYISGYDVGVAVRAVAGPSMYWLFAGATSSFLYKNLSGTNTDIGSVTGPGVVSGDLLRLEVRGTQLVAYINGQIVITATDAALSSGSPGFVGANNTGLPFVIDNFAGGDLNWAGTPTTVMYNPRLFSALDACSSTLEGQTAAVKDSTTQTWGATVTGLGSYHVKAYCDGTNWTVEAK